MAQKVAYISCPARGGSTFVQFVLSNHPEIVGLGELFRVVTDANSKRHQHWEGISCSCGAIASNCEFWSKLLPPESRDANDLSTEDVLKQFGKSFPGKILVDSSKNGDQIDRYQADPNVDLKVILLVRDYRGWVLSALKYQKMFRDKDIYQNHRIVFTNNRILMSYRWLYSTYKRMRMFRRKNIDVLYVYYENIVFDTDRQLTRINEFLGVDNTEWSPVIEQSNCHEVYGNSSMRSDAKKSSSIYYDSTWLGDARMALYSVLLLPASLFSTWMARTTRN